MQGHQLSNTRKLNRHWQSGGGGKVYNLYLNGYQRYAGWTPINPPTSGVMQNIIMESTFGNDFNFVSKSKIVPYGGDWITLGKFLYETWNKFLHSPRSVKLINLFVGGFYMADDGQGHNVPHFAEDVSWQARPGVGLPYPRQSSAVVIDPYNVANGATPEKWHAMQNFFSRLHLWVKNCPTPFLYPSQSQTSLPKYNSQGQIVGSENVPVYPMTFLLPTNTTYQNLPVTPSELLGTDLCFYIHLNSNVANYRQVEYSNYIAEYSRTYNRAIAGDNIFVPGPSEGKYSVITTNDQGVPDTHYIAKSVGKVRFFYDVDPNKSLEENAKIFERTL